MMRLIAMGMLMGLCAAAQNREVGRVKDYVGKAADCTFLRDGARQHFQQLLPVRENDVLEVKPGQAVILFLNGKDFHICGDSAKPPQGIPRCDAGPRYTIPRVPTPPENKPNVLVSFFQSFGSWLTAIEDEPERVFNADVPRPGDSIDIALIPATGIFLAEGRRTFELPWQGCRPAFFGLYRGDHTEKDDDAVVALSGQRGAKVHQDNVMLYPGAYHVVMSCEADKQVNVRRDVTVLRTRDLRTVPDFAGAGLPPDLLRVARAGWLAANTDSGWWLEAYLQIVDIPDSLGPARALRAALAKGQAPPRGQ